MRISDWSSDVCSSDLMTWFLTLDLIMFGAFVRLTDSGLGCSDWPGCYGNITPIGAANHIENALKAMPYGAVSVSKAWIEMIHRYAGSILGLLIIAIVRSEEHPSEIQ